MLSIILYTVIFLLSGCQGQGNFVKDQSVDRHVFPPVLEIPTKGVPQGHLRPLGYQRSADGRVLAAPKTVTMQQFRERCIERRSPCTLTEHYSPPAETLWGDKNLSKFFPEELFQVEIKQGKNSSRTNMQLLQFLKKYHHEEWKIESPMPDIMKRNLTVPIVLQCESQQEHMQDVHIWLSSGPTSSQLSMDADDQLHCLLSGRADFIVISADHKDVFQMEEQHYPHSGKASSKLDMNLVNMFENPNIFRVPWRWTTLTPKDCIFIPAGTLSQVRAYGRSVSVIFAFAPLHKYPHDCNNTKPIPNRPLETAPTLWSYSKGNWTINVSGWNCELLDRYLRSLIRNQDKLYVEQFAHFYNTAAGKKLGDTTEAWNAWKEFDPNLVGWITQQTFLEIPKHKREWLARVLESRRSGVPLKEEL